MKYPILVLTTIMIVGCTYDVFEIPVECTDPLSIVVTDQSDAACGALNGAFTLVVTANESEPLTYQLNNKTPQSSPSYSNLSAGSYNVLISNGICEGSIEVIIKNSEGLNAEATVVESECGSSEGAINISTSNASGNTMFSLDGASPQSSPDFTDLQSGNYVVNVSDGAGCNIEISATVGNASNYSVIASIVASSCAVSGCHAGNVNPDFRVKDNIVNNAARILARTSAQTMPPPSSGMSLSDSEISDIGCWVESGAQN